MEIHSRRTTLKQALFLTLCGPALQIAIGSEQPYAPFSAYQMSQQGEIALARSAAPSSISTHATIEVLTPKGYEVAIKGDSEFTCMVLRSWSAAPTPDDTRYAPIRAPICFDPIASKTVVPVEELKAKLGLAEKSPEEIGAEVALQYGQGKLPTMEKVAFAYMWSASQILGPGAGAWHPHMMIYAPYYKNQWLGNNPVGNHSSPFVAAEGTPYSIVIMAVDDKLAIKAASTD
jgi:hypothetical protein